MLKIGMRHIVDDALRNRRFGRIMKITDLSLRDIGLQFSKFFASSGGLPQTGHEHEVFLSDSQFGESLWDSPTFQCVHEDSSSGVNAQSHIVPVYAQLSQDVALQHDQVSNTL